MRITILVTFYGFFSTLAIVMGKLVDDSVTMLGSDNDSILIQENQSINRILLDSENHFNTNNEPFKDINSVEPQLD